MAASHVVSGLIAKHSELAGQIQFHKTEIERVIADLKHIDAALKLFSPETDLRKLGSKRPYKSSMGGFKRFKCKESHTWVLDQLRVAKKPVTTAIIADGIITAKGLEDSKDLRISIQRTLSGSLRRLEKRGLVKEVGRVGLAALWKIV